jgi:hypothetical protein
VAIIQFGDTGFDDSFKELGTLAGANPTFAPTFREYYIKSIAAPHLDKSCISLVQNEPVAGLFMTQSTRPGQNLLNYYGQPGTFIVNENSSHLETGLQELSDFVMRRGLKHEISKDGCEFELTISQRVLAHKTKLLDLILRESTSLSPHIVGKRELISSNLGASRNTAAWSRSTRSSLKKATELGLECRIFDKDSDRFEMKKAFWEFRSLHFSAAGRETRPEDSWREQLELVLKGNAFLSIAELAGARVGGAYFMHGFGSVYYGVAANDPKYENVPIGPLLLANSIDHSTKLRARNFWVGSQFSDKSAEVPKKLSSIEDFKSRYVDSLEVSLRAARKTD